MNIKELAEQAGFFPADNYDHTNWHAAGFSKVFERFAELVAAAERERIKQENQRCYVFNPDGTYQGSGGGGRPRDEVGDKHD